MKKSNVTSFPKEKVSQEKINIQNSLSPREIVSELDRFVVGQNKAKRAVAIALRNRWRRQLLGEELRAEVVPKNILMIGPTGCGTIPALCRGAFTPSMRLVSISQ